MNCQKVKEILDCIKSGKFFEDGCGLDLSTQPQFEDAIWEVLEIIEAYPDIMNAKNKIALLEAKTVVFKQINNSNDNIVTDPIHGGGNKCILYLDIIEISTVKELIVYIAEYIYNTHLKSNEL